MGSTVERREDRHDVGVRVPDEKGVANHSCPESCGEPEG